MRVFGFTLVSLVLGLTVVNAQKLARSANPRALRSSRAARSIGGTLRVRQTTTDTCANLDGQDLVVNAVDYGGLDGVVLCLSGVDAFIDTNAVAQDAAADQGVADTRAALNDLINASGEVCTYPAGSTPAATAEDPCAFTCDNGFTPSPAGDPTMCVCEAPAADCNGVCTTDACPSPGPVPRRRGYTNSLRKRAMCPAGTTACAVYERRGVRSNPVDCIDTDNDLESCGGCMNPLDSFSPKGRDCSAIPGAMSFKCKFGVCIVNSCDSGYVRAADNSSCISARRFLQQN